LLTLNIAANGSLSLLGSVVILQVPYPEIAADGTNVFIPTHPPSGVNIAPVNGTVVKVDVSSPGAPAVAAVTSLASPSVPPPNQTPVADATALTVSGGYIYVASGSESGPLDLTSSVQVVNESTMQLVGSPFIVPHSPQQIAVSGGVAYTTLYDGTGVESINVSNPANLQLLEIFSPSIPTGCHGLGLALRNTTAYVGCYQEGNVDRINISAPASMTQLNYISGLGSPQSLAFSSNYLFVVSAAAGGSVYLVYVGPAN